MVKLSGAKNEFVNKLTEKFCNAKKIKIHMPPKEELELMKKQEIEKAAQVLKDKTNLADDVFQKS